LKARLVASKLLAMAGYGQFCPVAQALEIVGERWTLLVVRELLCGNYRFNEILNGVPLMSRSLLAQRLKTLEEAGLVERQLRPDGKTHAYQLTTAGRELEPIIMGLGTWGQRWARRPYRDDELDPVLLMWDMHRNLDLNRVPDRALVMFWFRDLDSKRSRYWLRIAKPDVELCLTHPGFDVDLSIETTLRTMVEVWMGHRELAEALGSGAIRLEGPSHFTQEFPGWLLLNDFARIELPKEPRKERPATKRAPRAKGRAAL
jgi:DNA-binding HxlR family transcriptional regulator